MKKYLINSKKNVLYLAGLTLWAIPMVVGAQPPDLGLNYATEIGLGTRDVRAMVSTIINVLLGFLGIIAVVIILLGGFKWMTAGGNDEKTGEARKLIGAGVVGLIIILAAYAIASFVIDQIAASTFDAPAQ
ncbi:MAG: hypothetical protein COU22_00405 [Candidatus Komeilibacteria bacterium CG10_big_fil_rev_8_21_14_0_10_41_13]|uniref:Uncharacterized protein n=1 Tax=Candidatus Komeilibacteria bacterium CG10_big_fil_rev_8_21_14_0_10_41_13 TaxID=1974476 RepID=A0A2M6WD87_9BACT|nr:MAG: hypothetical protein COU22_00405 [Candidatus Komeilibacteria bacterium CG10_big_fil_rev_8_21_14_0_10_41_13]